jgi:hypothetical protein
MVCFVKRVSNVLDQYKGMGLNVKGLILGIVSYQSLPVSDPETKRKIIGRVLLKF